MKRILFIFINRYGELKKIMRPSKFPLDSDDGNLLMHYGPGPELMKRMAESGWNLCNWHVIQEKAE